MENVLYLIIGAVLGVLSSLAGYYFKYWLSEKSKKESREYEIKKRIYINLSRALKNFEVEGNEYKFVKEVHNILSEAYMIATDKVILGIKRIWEDKKDGTKLKGENIVALVSELRKDLIPDTKLSSQDYFYLELPRKNKK